METARSPDARMSQTSADPIDVEGQGGDAPAMKTVGMMRVWAAVLLGVAASAGGAVSQTAPEPPMLSARDLMRHVVNPAAELYWKGSGTVDTEAGAASRAPTTDATWTALANAAAVVQESGHLLSMPGRARDADWMRFSQQMALAGAAGLKAARAKDEDAVFEAGSAMYEACYACHGKYIPRPANSLYRQQLPDDAFKPPM